MRHSKSSPDPVLAVEAERETLLDALMSVSEWVPIYYLWRPNLREEADNHVIELAVVGNARYLVTNNQSAS